MILEFKGHERTDGSFDMLRIDSNIVNYIMIVNAVGEGDIVTLKARNILTDLEICSTEEDVGKINWSHLLKTSEEIEEFKQLCEFCRLKCVGGSFDILYAGDYFVNKANVKAFNFRQSGKLFEDVSAEYQLNIFFYEGEPLKIKIPEGMAEYAFKEINEMKLNNYVRADRYSNKIGGNKEGE